MSVFGLAFGAAFTEAAAEPVDDTAKTDEAWVSAPVGGDTFVAQGRRGSHFGGLVPKQVVPAAVEQCQGLREGQRPHSGAALDHLQTTQLGNGVGDLEIDVALAGVS